MLAIVALAAVAPLLAAAHRGCGGGEVMRRNPGGRLIQKRQTQATEQSVAVSLDVPTECTGYSYQPVLDLKPMYPEAWVTTGADIVAGDSEAMTLFASINASLNAKLPNVQVKGTGSHDGDWTGFTYNASDPDCWWTWRQCVTPASNTGLANDIISTPEPLSWGLAFDDGPNCSHNALYDYLLENNQKATVFYIGSNIFDWPLQAMRGLDEGHHICAHTWSHQYMTSFSNQQAFAELYYSKKIIKDILGVTPMCWRAPYGDTDNRIRFIAESLNLTSVLWTHDTEDWKLDVPADNVTVADVTANYQGVIDAAKNGSLNTEGTCVLNHELTNQTMSLFLDNYPTIKSTFQHVIPISAAYNWTHCYAETNYTCPDFATYISGQTNISVTATEVDSASSTFQDGGFGGGNLAAVDQSSASSASGSATASGASGSSSASKSASSSSSSAKSGSAGQRVSAGFSGNGIALALAGVVAGGMVVLA